MAFPLTTALPPLGTHESDTLDFKQAPSEGDDVGARAFRTECAKDVSAMANTSGGTILVGACGGSTVKRYEELPLPRMIALGRAYEEAVRDLCRPGPQCSVAPLPSGAGYVLSVHVLPHPWPVGVSFKVSKEIADKEITAWAFFRRIASQTKEILPDMLPMMTPESRRAAILLQAIPTNAKVTVVRTGTTAPGAGAVPVGTGRVSAVMDDVNAFTFTFKSGPNIIERNFAIDMIRTVYRGRGGDWFVDLLPYNDVNATE
jgi:hypothetical protein